MKLVLDHPIVRKHGSKFLRFLVCGGLGACVDFGSLYYMLSIARWEPKYALLISKGLALIFVFLANRFFTFRSHGGHAGKQAVKFFMVYLSAASLNYALTLTFITVGIHPMISNALAIGILMFFNFFFLNSFVFKRAHIEEEIIVA